MYASPRRLLSALAVHVDRLICMKVAFRQSFRSEDQQAMATFVIISIGRRHGSLVDWNSKEERLKDSNDIASCSMALRQSYHPSRQRSRRS